MPKIITAYPYAKLKSVEKISDMDNELWLWRKQYIGFKGMLAIFQSEKRFPGKHYIHLTDYSDHITTGYGYYTIDKNIITIITRNSVYEYEILNGDDTKCKENF